MPRPLGRRLAFLLALLPPAAIAWLIYRYGVDVPYGDQFHFVPYLARGAHVGFVELAAFHNDHRILFPRLIMLALARATDWNVRAELWVTFVLAAGILVIVWRRLAREDLSPWALPLVSLLIFTFVQWDNWLWGWQLQMMLNVLAVVAGLALASGPTPTPLRLAGTIAFGVVAQNSFANGVFYWPLAAAVMWSRGRRGGAFGVLGAGALSTWLALIGYFRQPTGLSLAPGPGKQLLYALVYLGQPVLPGAHTGIDWRVIHWRLLAAAGLSLLGMVTVVLVARRSRDDDPLRARSAFALALAGYAVASALLTAAGRSFAGVGQATSPRYVAMAMLLWIALTGLAGRLRGWRWLLAPIALLALAGQGPMLRMGIADAATRARLRDDLLDGKTESYPALMVIGDPALVARGRQVLQAQRLSCFRDRPPPAPASAP